MIQSALFGMAKSPFGKVRWPPTRGWKGHFESPGAWFLILVTRFCLSPRCWCMGWHWKQIFTLEKKFIYTGKKNLITLEKKILGFLVSWPSGPPGPPGPLVVYEEISFQKSLNFRFIWFYTQEPLKVPPPWKYSSHRKIGRTRIFPTTIFHGCWQFQGVYIW